MAIIIIKKNICVRTRREEEGGEIQESQDYFLYLTLCHYL